MSGILVLIFCVVLLFFICIVGKFFTGKPAAAGESAGSKKHSRRTVEEGDGSKGSYVWV